MKTRDKGQFGPKSFGDERQIGSGSGSFGIFSHNEKLYGLPEEPVISFVRSNLKRPFNHLLPRKARSPPEYSNAVYSPNTTRRGIDDARLTISSNNGIPDQRSSNHWSRSFKKERTNPNFFHQEHFSLAQSLMRSNQLRCLAEFHCRPPVF